jgi:hypothetical protein
MLRHLAKVAALLFWILMVKDKHIGVVYRASFPFALLGLEEFVEPFSVTVRFGFVSRKVSTRMSLVVLDVNLSFTCAAIWLQPVGVARKFMKFARSFDDLATKTLLRH